MPYIPTEPVESSNIERIGYHRQSQTLRVIFHGGRAYDYPMVPETEFKKMMEAESKGKFLNMRIKSMYSHRTPRPEELQPPAETCCDHPTKDCDDACGDCDPECCSRAATASAVNAVVNGLEFGKRLVDSAAASDQIEDASSDQIEDDDGDTLVEMTTELPLDEEGNIDYSAISNATDVVQKTEQPDEEVDGDSPERDDLIDATLCSCCGTGIQVLSEDARDLCMPCLMSKDGDTNDSCTIEHTTKED